LKELGDVKAFIGMQFVRDRATRRICMHQTDYTKRMIAKFVSDLDSMRSVKTPWLLGTQIPHNWKELANPEKRPQ